MKILMILTSHDRLGYTGDKTGFWLEEFAAPYYVFVDAGADVTVASPKGGQPPLDPKSELPDAQTEATQRFRDDAAANDALASTHMLAEIDVADYDAVFYPGGHGPLWDLTNSTHSIAVIEDAIAADIPIALVCHAPGALTGRRSSKGGRLQASPMRKKMRSGLRKWCRSSSRKCSRKMVGFTPRVPISRLMWCRTAC